MRLVRVRTYLGKSLLGEPMRPYASNITVKVVVDRAIEPLEGIELVGTVDVFKDAADKNRTAQLPLDGVRGTDRMRRQKRAWPARTTARRRAAGAGACGARARLASVLQKSVRASAPG